MNIINEYKKEDNIGIVANSIVHGDCLEVMNGIKDKSIDMILCDLPYGTTACKWDIIIPFEPLWKLYKRIIKDNGAIVLFGSEPFTSHLILSNLKAYREKLTWEKHKAGNFGCAKYMHLKYTEDIVVFSKKRCTYNPQMIKRTSDRVRQAQKGKSKQWNSIREQSEEVSFATQYQPKEWTYYNADLKYPSNVLKFPSVVSNSKEKVNHPTQKPIKLLEYLIKTYTNEGDLVLDNCMGSGSTAIACINTNRNYIGFELDKQYCGIANERIQKALAEKEVQ